MIWKIPESRRNRENFDPIPKLYKDGVLVKSSLLVEFIQFIKMLSSIDFSHTMPFSFIGLINIIDISLAH